MTRGMVLDDVAHGAGKSRSSKASPALSLRDDGPSTSRRLPTCCNQDSAVECEVPQCLACPSALHASQIFCAIPLTGPLERRHARFRIETGRNSDRIPSTHETQKVLCVSFSVEDFRRDSSSGNHVGDLDPVHGMHRTTRGVVEALRARSTMTTTPRRRAATLPSFIDLVSCHLARRLRDGVGGPSKNPGVSTTRSVRTNAASGGERCRICARYESTWLRDRPCKFFYLMHEAAEICAATRRYARRRCIFFSSPDELIRRHPEAAEARLPS